MNKGRDKAKMPEGVKSMEIRTVPIDKSEVSKMPSALPPPTDEREPRDWAQWGDDDNWPLSYYENLSKSGVALTGIDTNASMHYGLGMGWFKDVVSEDGKVKKVPANPVGWNTLDRSTNFSGALASLVHSLETFYLAFVEVIMTKDKTRPAYFQLLDTIYCRKQKKDKNGKYTKIFYSPDFGVSTPENPASIDIFDPDRTGENIQDKFVLIFEYGTYGRRYYPRPNVVSVIENGWMDIAQSVPRNIKSIYKNQISPRYQIFIPLEHLRTKFKDWDQKSEKEQLSLIEEEQLAIEEGLVGEENSAKSIVSVYDGPVKEQYTISIEPIKSPMDEVNDKDLPSNAIANAEICTSLGIAPALGGITVPGGSNLSGSGSDVRENRKSKQANLKLERETSLQFARIIAMIMGYPDDIYPAYIDIDTSETLDQAKEVKPKVE